jgi:Mce-associated membrane protein
VEVAVPGAHDRPVGPSDSRSSSRIPTVLATVSTALAVACLVVLGVRFAGADGSFGDRVRTMAGADLEQEAAEEATRTRDLVMSQASQFVIRVNTFGPDDLEGESQTMPDWVERVEEVITPKLAVDFERGATSTGQLVADQQLESSAEVYATGAETIGDDTATVLVAGAISETVADTEEDGRVEVEPRTFRIRVTLVETGGRWLVDDYGLVRGESAGDPTSPTDPAAGADSPALERYAEIIANRRAVVDDAVAVLDSCGFPAAAQGAECTRAPQGLIDAARVLVGSLRAASNPDSEDFAGQVSAEVGQLVVATQAAGLNVLQAGQALPRECVTSTSAACQEQRRTFAGTQRTLLNALATWDQL